MSESANTHDDASEEPNAPARTHRDAHVCRDDDGNLLGTAMFLGHDDLVALGVEDAEAVTYQVTPDGAIAVVSRGESNV